MQPLKENLKKKKIAQARFYNQAMRQPGLSPLKQNPSNLFQQNKSPIQNRLSSRTDMASTSVNTIPRRNFPKNNTARRNLRNQKVQRNQLQNQSGFKLQGNQLQRNQLQRNRLQRNQLQRNQNNSPKKFTLNRPNLQHPAEAMLLADSSNQINNQFFSRNTLPLRNDMTYTIEVANDLKEKNNLPKHHISADLNPMLQAEIRQIQSRNNVHEIIPPVPIHSKGAGVTTRTLNERFSEYF